MAKYTQKQQRKLITIMAVVLSLSTLYYFKYFNFFGETINFFLQKSGIGLNIPLHQIILPVGISFFTFQIYCDFSGYSDLARGSARIMGFRLMVNFRFTYFPRNVSAYWQKNHISLTTWLKDYIYYPLVEKKPTISRMCLITMFTFLLSGLWHGADWTFVIWGGWQAVFLIYDILIRRFRKKLDKWLKKRRLLNLSFYFRYLITFVIIALGLVFFRASSISQAQEILTGIISVKPGEIYLNYSAVLYSLAGITILISAEYNDLHDFDEFVQLRFKNKILRWGYYYFILMMILALGSKASAEFIYFQF